MNLNVCSVIRNMQAAMHKKGTKGDMTACHSLVINANIHACSATNLNIMSNVTQVGVYTHVHTEDAKKVSQRRRGCSNMAKYMTVRNTHAMCVASRVLLRRAIFDSIKRDMPEALLHAVAALQAKRQHLGRSIRDHAISVSC